MACLWIGGSSSLARTYFEELKPPRHAFIVAGPDQLPPEHPAAVYPFAECDLSSYSSVATLFSRLAVMKLTNIHSVVIGVRLSLLSMGHERLGVHFDKLVSEAARAGVQYILHISSVAVADHLQAQHLVREDVLFSSLDTYHGDYDRFKRRSEEVIAEACDGAGLRHTHLRLSAIFSNGPECIQCGAMAWQKYVGCFNPHGLDCNSALNVAHAISLLLEVEDADSDRNRANIYYYTRPSVKPLPYGSYVVDYRMAHGVAGAWLPFSVLALLIRLYHVCVSVLPFWDIFSFLHAVDYLLQVSSREHTFDNSLFRTHFPEIKEREETILQAFRRIALRSRKIE
ncbi:unnamed protein product [Prorocentrum cordatum]|uniref:NAD-dependent epimerase/dehydratase domain-containing protein n=1 Tax=Prorocentrum cordatum TaxID=2364126 RepID=A0ABN9Y5X4_9DINO|nr:unnamed protein product [Polarella glacialis]